MRAGIGQARWRPSSSAPGPSAARMWGRSSSPDHSSFISCACAGVAVAQHAEADVGPAVGQRERPRVAGQQVGVEPHVQVLGRRAGDVAGVLRGRRATRRGNPASASPSRLAHRGPHAVGGDDVAGGDRRDARRRPTATWSSSLVEPARRSRSPRRTSAPALRGEVDERGVELPPRARRRRTCRRRRGSGTTTSRPDGERSTAPSTTFQSSHRRPGRSRASSSSRRASVVSPSPQHLSRGNPPCRSA